MDTGEFIALDVPEDELRLTANSNGERVAELEAYILEAYQRVHNTWHGDREIETCNYSTCHMARHILWGEVGGAPDTRG